MAIIHIIMIFASAIVASIVLAPEAKEEYRDVTNSENIRKPRFVKIILYICVGAVMAVFAFQGLFSSILFLGSFKKFVISIYVETVTPITLG